jgi:hypothetical protein
LSTTDTRSVVVLCPDKNRLSASSSAARPLRR